MKHKTHNGDLLYMKKIIILLSILMCSQITNAGMVKKAVVGGVIYENRLLIGGLVAGYVTNYREANELASEITKRILDEYNNGIKYIHHGIRNELIYRAETNLYKFNVPLMILEKLDWIDKNVKRDIKENNERFKEATTYLTERAGEVVDWSEEKNDKRCSGSNSSDSLLTMVRYTSINYPKVNVSPFTVSTYKHLTSSSYPDYREDELEHDHIPSAQAVVAYLQNKKGRILTEKEKKRVATNAIAITIPKQLHEAGRTHSGNNTESLKELDGKDTFVAFFKDYALHFLNLQFRKNRTYHKKGIFGDRETTMKLKKARKKLIRGMVKHFKLNNDLCLFQKIK
jgi:hypothetical protein